MPPKGQTTGAVRVTLQIEGAMIAGLAVAGFAVSGASWWVFALLILAPDVAMLGYLVGPRVGACTYNVAHTYSTPIGLAALGAIFGWPLALPIACVWIAHIGADRAIGYGLKYGGGFKATHLSAPSAPS